MTRIHYWLGGLLALQLLIAVGLLWGRGEGRTVSQEPYLGLELDKIDGIKVGGPDNTVTLAKKDGHWLIPELEQLPASDAKIEAILTKLKNFKPAWPVATTTASHTRFEVADDKFQRKVQFYQGNTLAAGWYLGTSPGFRKNHIRKAGDDGVYTVMMSSFDLPVKNGDWLDKGLIGVAGITSIKGQDYALAKKDNIWRFVAAGTAEGEDNPELDQDKAQKLASALAGLQVLGVAEKALDGTLKTVEVAAPEGSWTYRFMQADDKYYVGRNDRSTVFTLSQFDFERIVKVDMSKLVKEQKEPDTEAVNGDGPEQEQPGEPKEPEPSQK